MINWIYSKILSPEKYQKRLERKRKKREQLLLRVTRNEIRGKVRGTRSTHKSSHHSQRNTKVFTFIEGFDHSRNRHSKSPKKDDFDDTETDNRHHDSKKDHQHHSGNDDGDKSDRGSGDTVSRKNSKRGDTGGSDRGGGGSKWTSYSKRNSDQKFSKDSKKKIGI